LVYCLPTEDGFYNRKWKVIGNSPLEELLKEPIYFYHMSFISTECRVFEMWGDHNKETIIKESECEKMNWGHFGIEQWASYSTEHIIKRLNARLTGVSYIKGWLPDNWETLNFRMLPRPWIHKK